MRRLTLPLAIVLAAPMVATPVALASLHIVRGPAIPPNPRTIPPRTIMVGGPPTAQRTVHAIPRAPRRAGPTNDRPRIASAKLAYREPRRAAPSPLTYHGGYTMTYDLTYPVFWEPRTLQDGTKGDIPGRFNALVYRYFTDIGGSGLYNNNTQYYSQLAGTTTYIQNQSAPGGYVVDTYPYPPGGCRTVYTGRNCVSDRQLQTTLRKVIRVAGWAPSLYHGFFVYVSKGEGVCNSRACYPGDICAYHGYGAHRFGRFIYAPIPYQNACRTRAMGRELAPNHNSAIDSTIDTTSHEQMEEVTDPYEGAWFGDGGLGDEMADRCVVYGPRPFDGGAANQDLRGNVYILQMEWDNLAGGCEQSGP
jgi:hypothetical protein